MSRLTCVLLLVAAANPLAAQTSTPYAGRLLTDVLREIQAHGIKLVYSDELVRPALRVLAEPRARAPRRLLDEVLNPHGLTTRDGPNGTVLVVRSTRTSQPPKAMVGEPRVGGVSGRVIDAGTGAPLAGVMVEVQSSGHATRTDEQGGFALAGVPVGRQALYVSTIGYALARPVVEVVPNGDATVIVPLAEGTGAYIERVTVTADRPHPADATMPLQETLGSAALQSVREVLVDDPFRAVHALPGVVANDDFRSDFSVRGIDFEHLGLSIDGVATPWLLHSFEETQDSGSMSTLNSDLLDHLTLSFGAYPQRHGNRVGAWLDMTMREGSRSARALRASISGTNFSLAAEGPIGRARNGSWLVSFRQSYVDWLVRHVAPEFDSVFGFTDLQGKLVYDLTPRHQIQFTTVAGISRLNQNHVSLPVETARASSNLVLGTLALRSTIGSSAVLTQRTAVVAQQFTNLNPQGATTAEGDFGAASYRADLLWRPRPTVSVETGAMFERQWSERTTRRFAVPVNPSPAVVLRTDSFDASAGTPSAYAHVVFGEGRRFSISPGVRMSHSTITQETVASPWVQASWPMGPTTMWRAGVGLHYQFPQLAQAYGPHAGTGLRSERSLHYELTMDTRMTQSLSLRSTSFFRGDDRFLRREAAEYRMVDGQLVVPQPDDPWRNALDGYAFGLESTLEWKGTQRLSGWISYAINFTAYSDPLAVESFAGDFDQSHTVNAWGQYALSSRTSFSAKLRFGSNIPVRGYFERRDGGLYIGEERNTLRVPAYARLDLRANRVFNYTKRRLTLFVEVMNVLNRENVRRVASPTIDLRTGRVTEIFQSLFPILPSAGLLFEF